MIERTMKIELENGLEAKTCCSACTEGKHA